MVATLSGAGAAPTWLVPGQSFRSSDPGWLGEFRVARIVRDVHGFCHAVLHDNLGREVSTFVDQIQFSIAEGLLIPIDDAASRISAN